MKTVPVSLGLIVALAVTAAGGGAFFGYQTGKSKGAALERDKQAALAEAAPAPPQEKLPPAAEPITEAEVEAFLSGDEPEPAENLAQGFGNESPEEMEARRQRWETMTAEQRQVFRRAMFSALAKVDGLEEVGDAIREGKIDPRQFSLNPAEIADRMEFYAETMDQQAIEQEMTRSLEEVVQQAREQMK